MNENAPADQGDHLSSDGGPDSSGDVAFPPRVTEDEVRPGDADESEPPGFTLLYAREIRAHWDPDFDYGDSRGAWVIDEFHEWRRDGGVV